MIPANGICELLNAARTKAGGTISGLAHALGVPRTTATSWFSRGGLMSLSNWQRLHEWMGRKSDRPSRRRRRV